ncbi:MAG: carboxylating nicotinate-nucleotide diphosphorylase [Deltaproteobacteria bacterium]|jgi:nicotinate-nucleotide pyrophosphorylase (carboxylating)|nr:carboxylating nicotinate-nucleotide diphosphorylase [Deltaproteobacteria bacterium]
MDYPLFTNFFTAGARAFLNSALDLALAEDGADLTSQGIFPPQARAYALITAKETSLVAGLPIIPLIMERCELSRAAWEWRALVTEGERVEPGRALVHIEGSTRGLLKAERVMLNVLSHLSGIANCTRCYAEALEGTGTRLLDTRKTLPCLRWPDKYAVLVGGGHNHRRDLSEMLMIKDNHIDAAGSIREAVSRLRGLYGAGCPPIEVECRNLEELREALDSGVERVMLDNMDIPALAAALPLIPPQVEAEVSGGVTLDNIRALALASSRRPDFISVGRITHSAPAADFSMHINNKTLL